jgi:hypothetical protein
MTEGIDTVFENVYNFLRLCHQLFQSSFSPPRRIGSETSKKVYWVRNVREDYSRDFLRLGWKTWFQGNETNDDFTTEV